MRAFFSFRLILNRLTIGLRIHPSVRESGLIVGGVGGPLAADPAGGLYLSAASMADLSRFQTAGLAGGVSRDSL